MARNYPLPASLALSSLEATGPTKATNTALKRKGGESVKIASFLNFVRVKASRKKLSVDCFVPHSLHLTTRQMNEMISGCPFKVNE